MRTGFFDSQLEQSKVKTAIVSKYFWTWAKIILSNRSIGRIAYVDLFAGGKADPAPDKRLLHLAMRTDDVDAALAAAVEAGAITTIEPEDVVIPGNPAEATVRIAFCTGPDNEVIEFIQSTAGSIP